MKDPQKPRVWNFSLGILGMIVLSYFVASGPVLAFATTHPRFAAAVYSFYRSVAWLQYKTVLGRPIEAYVRVWLDVFRNPQEKTLHELHEFARINPNE